MRNRLNSRTVLSIKVFLLFVSGIVLSDKLRFNWIFLIAISSVWLISFKFKYYRFSQYVLVIMIFMLGGILAKTSKVVDVEPEDVYIQGKIIRDGTFNPDKNKAYISVIYPDYLRGKKIRVINYNRYYKIFPGDEIVFKGFVTRFNDKIEQYYENNGIYGKTTIGKNSYVKVLKCGNSKPINKPLIFLDIFRKEVFAPLPGEYNSLLMSFLFGERDRLSRNTRNMFKNSGINHLLALSGLHMAVIMGILFLVARLFRLNMKFTTFFVFLAIIVYLIFINFRVSAFRASVMLSVIMISYLVNRYVSSYNLLFAVGFIILLLAPHQIYTPGFLLSFSATLAILIYNDLVNIPVKSRIQKNILYPFMVSVFISFFTLPVLIYFFHWVSVMTPIANIVFIPLTSFIITLGILAIIFHVFSPVLSNYIVAVIYFTEKIYFHLLAYFNRFHFRINAGGKEGLILLVIPLSIILFMIYRQRDKKTDVLSGI
ncbi:MAG: hypothetical protein GWP03_05735 [Proteobacteria bacterium]|nr:hypothetical protein [Pseudomonadota bacterium]